MHLLSSSNLISLIIIKYISVNVCKQYTKNIGFVVLALVLLHISVVSPKLAVLFIWFN